MRQPIANPCYPHRMSIFVRAFAWLLAAAVTFATLGPPSLRPHSDLSQDGEHALAFILVGLAFGLAYRQRRLAVAAIAVVLIGLIELLQFWAPGRHARLEDFVVDAATACVGFALAAAADWVLTRLRASSAITSEGPAE
jgi:VanZ family protein